ncbi:transposable element Tc1 transposase [Trichonephila clavipes]|uniref:Transposable element Tc1 transposase n=1 Tax=Trichonephila clavipes TaxID=2585209 RepID=A0A8X6SJF9_TRICX|nr:transposable element Tc1 transposase [Trichonephila clavipes]
MDWPAYSSDLNPIEHVGCFGRRITARLHHPENTQQLKHMLIEEWALLPQEMLQKLVLSMRTRCEATIARMEKTIRALGHHIGGKSFHDDDEIKDVVMWFRQQAATFYDCGIQKLVHRHNKCLDNGGDHAEK